MARTWHRSARHLVRCLHKINLLFLSGPWRWGLAHLIPGSTTHVERQSVAVATSRDTCALSCANRPAQMIYRLYTRVLETKAPYLSVSSLANSGPTLTSSWALDASVHQHRSLQAIRWQECATPFLYKSFQHVISLWQAAHATLNSHNRDDVRKPNSVGWDTNVLCSVEVFGIPNEGRIEPILKNKLKIYEPCLPKFKGKWLIKLNVRNFTHGS